MKLVSMVFENVGMHALAKEGLLEAFVTLIIANANAQLLRMHVMGT